MRGVIRALLVVALAFGTGAAIPSTTAGAQVLVLRLDGAEVMRHPLPVCLVWNHSVTGGLVADCLDQEAGTLILRKSYLHDFAPGLGEVIGRGTLTPDPRGGYWIDGLDAPLPQGLVLRVGGPAVAHRLMVDPFGADADPLNLPRGARLLLTLN